MKPNPGLIEGAAEGAGLGHQFLRHLQRTKLLLHLVDMAPFDDSIDPAAEVKAIAAELVISESAVEKHVGRIFDKLRLPQSDSDHRRVLAVLAYLNEVG